MAFRAGKCLLRLRLSQAGMTQKQLAERVNLSPQMISHYVMGRKVMSLENAKSISAVLNCNIEDLYLWEHVRDR
ncbi:helix-turn-helix transcriptional regulator [Paenibacillus oleatilyticus]|uniref:Helix-turn-helix transcriptional regulator n=1 Tax=Paenibacillus oleatilyticus TaxID=2594886 RepID=A0ABV4VCA1_9BACL